MATAKTYDVTIHLEPKDPEDAHYYGYDATDAIRTVVAEDEESAIKEALKRIGKEGWPEYNPTTTKAELANPTPICITAEEEDAIAIAQGYAEIHADDNSDVAAACETLDRLLRDLEGYRRIERRKERA